MSKKLLSSLKMLLFISVGVGIVFLFYFKMSKEDQTAFWSAIQRANYGWLFASMALGLLSHFIRALRWGRLLSSLNYSARYPNLFFAVMNMYFFNLAVPRLGELTRCTLLYKYEKVPFEKAFGTVLAERAVDLLCLLLFMGASILLMLPEFKEMMVLLRSGEASSDTGSNNVLLWLAAAFLLLITFFLLLKNSIPLLNRIFNRLRALAIGVRDGLRSVLKLRQPGWFLLETLGIWTCYFFMTRVCFFALPETAEITLKAPMAIVAFASLAILFIPGGVGAFPLMVSGMLLVPGLGGLEHSLGWALGWIIWSAQTAMIVGIGLISLLLTPLYNQRFSHVNHSFHP